MKYIEQTSSNSAFYPVLMILFLFIVISTLQGLNPTAAGKKCFFFAMWYMPGSIEFENDDIE